MFTFNKSLLDIVESFDRGKTTVTVQIQTKIRKRENTSFYDIPFVHHDIHSLVEVLCENFVEETGLSLDRLHFTIDEYTYDSIGGNLSLDQQSELMIFRVLDGEQINIEVEDFHVKDEVY